MKNEQVLDFLEKNPDFFIKNPNVLKKVNFPIKNNAEYDEKSKVVPFKDWIIESLKDAQKNIIENARHNFITQQKIHDSVIDILRIDNVKDLFIFMKDELPSKFNLDVINIAHHAFYHILKLKLKITIKFQFVLMVDVNKNY